MRNVGLSISYFLQST